MTDEFADEIIITTLLFWVKKLRRGDCTSEQKRAVFEAMQTVGESYATVDELAGFYGKSKDAVNSVIKRRYIGKPRRNIVMYSFSKFARIVPESWRRKNDKSGT